MKAKKWVTFITAGVSAISLICAIIAYVNNVDLMYDISMAIFGSALLGFIMSLIEYFAERRKAMEDFLGAAYKIYVQLRKIKLLKLDEPKELILDCILEEQSNKMWGKCDGETAKEFGFGAVHKNRDAYIAWMEENEPMYFSEDDDIESILIKTYNGRIEHYSDMFMKYMDMYIIASQIDLENLSNAYGNLDFLFGNKKIRIAAFESIYAKLQEYRNKIASEVFHFNMVKDGKGNFAVCCKKIMELNDFFFATEITVSDGIERTIVYQEKFDNVSDRIEEFRSKIYFRKEVRYEEKTPVFSQLRRINGSAEEESAF
jgi:uncharacterized protein YlzI (FlbEa/FlbD family)